MVLGLGWGVGSNAQNTIHALPVWYAASQNALRRCNAPNQPIIYFIYHPSILPTSRTPFFDFEILITHLILPPIPPPLLPQPTVKLRLPNFRLTSLCALPIHSLHSSLPRTLGSFSGRLIQAWKSWAQTQQECSSEIGVGTSGSCFRTRVAR